MALQLCFRHFLFDELSHYVLPSMRIYMLHMNIFHHSQRPPSSPAQSSSHNT